MTATCTYCRVTSNGSDRTCPHCGAPIDIREPPQVTDAALVDQAERQAMLSRLSAMGIFDLRREIKHMTDDELLISGLDFLRDSADSRCPCRRLYSLRFATFVAVIQSPHHGPAYDHVGFARGIHVPHSSCPTRAVISATCPTARTSAETRRQEIRKVGPVGFELTNPSLVRSAPYSRN
jgi:hypothetical protein